MSYQDIKEQLERQGYQVGEEIRLDNSIAIRIKKEDTEVGFITFFIGEQSVGYKRPTKYRIGDEEEVVCSINYISVNTEFQGRGLGYYLMLLASLYTKEHYPNITKAKLDDCSDKSGDVVGNLYFKTKMTPTEPQKLLLPGEVSGSVPLTKKRGSLHLPPMCGPERVGTLDDIIRASLSKINKGGKSKKTKKTIRNRKIRKTIKKRKSRRNKK